MVTSFLYYINYIIAIFFKYAYSQYGTILINVSDFFVNVSRETFFLDENLVERFYHIGGTSGFNSIAWCI